MRVIADLHIHSRYSRATSERMSVKEIARFAGIKGLTLVGTGDFTHPKWLEELGKTLVPESGTNLYKSTETPESLVRFMLTTEVSTIFTFENKVRKVHHVILAPSVDIVAQINERLSAFGSLSSDGRPTLDMSASHLVEEVISVSNRNMIFPAHAWTPWFSIFGAFSGFDRMDECYQDMTKHIYALETGLSSDPPMNWRLSMLDHFTLISNSDSHSFWPWRIGREANVFELERLNYDEIFDAIKNKDQERFKFTIETDPAYGKYHWTGHRACNVSFSSEDAQKVGNKCPVCGRKLTKGVEQRVEELADRPIGFRPKNAIGFKRLLPLSEVIATFLGVDSPSVQKVWNVYNSLITKFGNEYSVLLGAPKEALSTIVDEKLADAIVRAREGRVTVVPGYDGVYGQLVLSEERLKDNVRHGSVEQRNLTDYMQ